jgi:hypothetical protein
MGPPFWPPEQRNEPSLTSFRRFLRLEVRAYRGFSDGFLTEFSEVGEEIIRNSSPIARVVALINFRRG